ncbi:MAG: type IX secretion system PorP/SprF family membrane protein [Ulvibacter sp.]
MRRGIFLFAILVCVSLSTNAQHNGIFSQYMFNTMVINSGYTGSKEVLTANMNLRQQWTGFSGAPTTQFLSVHAPLKNKKLAVGGMINREVIGVSSDFKVSGTFAYRLKTKKGKLSMGVSAGIGMSSANWSEINTIDNGDLLFQNNENGSLRPVFGTGFFYSEKTWFAGYSIPSLLSYNYDVSGTKLNANFNLNQTEHILNGGYVFEVNRKLHVKPSMLLRYQPTTGVQTDINTNVIFDNQYWIGLSYRTTKEIIAILEYNVNYKLKVGYAYDFNFSELSTYSSGSHELSIEYGWGMFVKGRSPRHF